MKKLLLSLGLVSLIAPVASQAQYLVPPDADVVGPTRPPAPTPAPTPTPTPPSPSRSDSEELKEAIDDFVCAVLDGCLPRPKPPSGWVPFIGTKTYYLPGYGTHTISSFRHSGGLHARVYGTRGSATLSNIDCPRLSYSSTKRSKFTHAALVSYCRGY